MQKTAEGYRRCCLCLGTSFSDLLRRFAAPGNESMIGRNPADVEMVVVVGAIVVSAECNSVVVVAGSVELVDVVVYVEV